MDALEAMFARRSIGRLAEPAPDDVQLELILRAGAAAPDHGELRPWRFIVLRGDAKDAFGTVLEDAYVARCDARGVAPHPDKRAKERTKLGRAPLVVVVGVHRRDDVVDKFPWEDQLGAGHAAAQNILLAATALGFGSIWRTGDPCFDDRVKLALGLASQDAIVGFLYIGTVRAGDEKPPRAPVVDDLTVEWAPA